MRTTLKLGHVLAMIGLLGLGLGTIAWTGNGSQQITQNIQDTIPGRQKSTRESNKKMRDLDKELAELDKAMQELEGIDQKKIQQEIEAAMKQLQESLSTQKVDMQKIQEQLRLSLKEVEKIDVEKIKADVEKSLRDLKLDEARLQKEIRESLREVEKIDAQKMKAEIEKELNESLAKIDMEKMKIDMEKVKEEMERSKENLKVDLEKARKDMAKAREELSGYQRMLEEMEKDGLLNTKEDYKVQYKNKELFINGKKQPAEVTDKYRKYFKKDTTIEKEEGNMNINSNDHGDGPA
jgi:chromosome segregation ATPase